MAETVIGDFWSLTQSQVYRELDRMADSSLVEPGDAGARNRRPFAITTAGKEAFAEWIDQPPEPEHIRFPLLLTVSFGRHLAPVRLREHVEQHREIHAERLADYERQHREAAAADTEADPFALATLEFGLAYERAVVAWCDSLSDRLPADGERTRTRNDAAALTGPWGGQVSRSESRVTSRPRRGRGSCW